jgi:hypothetical protein
VRTYNELIAVWFGIEAAGHEAVPIGPRTAMEVWREYRNTVNIVL